MTGPRPDPTEETGRRRESESEVRKRETTVPALCNLQANCHLLVVAIAWLKMAPKTAKMEMEAAELYLGHGIAGPRRERIPCIAPGLHNTRIRVPILLDGWLQLSSVPHLRLMNLLSLVCSQTTTGAGPNLFINCRILRRVEATLDATLSFAHFWLGNLKDSNRTRWLGLIQGAFRRIPLDFQCPVRGSHSMRAGHSQQPVRCQCNFLHLAGLCGQWPSCPLDWRRAHSRPPRPLPSGFFFGPVAVMPPRVARPVAVAKPPADRSVDLRRPGSSSSLDIRIRIGQSPLFTTTLVSIPGS